MSDMTVVEVNGVKLEVDLRTAKRIDTLRVGSRVKCCVKRYGDYMVCPGVVINFEPFKTLPSICVCYIDRDHDLVFKSYNSKSEDFEIIADNNDNSLEQDRDSVMRTLTRNIEKAQVALNEAIEKKKFFEAQFGALCPIKEE